MKHIFAVCAAALLFCGCFTSRDVARISIGMRYQDMVNLCGQPAMKTVVDSTTTVYYYVFGRGEPAETDTADYYCVTVQNARVQRHGLCPARK
jgi:hypothetical protein